MKMKKKKRRKERKKRGKINDQKKQVNIAQKVSLRSVTVIHMTSITNALAIVAFFNNKKI